MLIRPLQGPLVPLGGSGLPWDVGGGRPASWTPAEIASVRGWYRGDDVILAATDVDVFTDKSPYGNHLAATAAGNRPAYNATGFNGGSQPYLSHASDWLRRAAFDWGGDFAACSVVWIGLTDTTASNRYVMDYSPDAGTNRRFLYADTSHRINWSASGAGSGTSTRLGAATSAGMYWGRWDGSSQTVGADVTVGDTDANTHAAYVDGGPLTFGATYAGLNPMVGETAELIITAAELTADELTALYAYATERYGV